MWSVVSEAAVLYVCHVPLLLMRRVWKFEKDNLVVLIDSAVRGGV